MSPTFWSLFQESVITQSVLTVMLWGATIAMMLLGKPIPELLAAGDVAILSFWMGSKTGFSQGVSQTTAAVTPCPPEREG